MNDAALKEGLRKGDRQALEEIYRRYFNRTVHWVLQNSGTEDEAKDVFQEALAATYQQMRNPGFAIQYQLGTYLYTICRNIWLKHLRDDKVLRHANDQGLQFVESEQAADAGSLVTEEHLYRKKFLALGQQCQQLLQHYLQGHTVRHITQTMGFSSESYTKKRKFQCKTQLIKLIQADPLYQTIKAS